MRASTQTGAVMGTATYFSPEQAQGQPVDARSDVYSLGIVLYEMVTGRPPFSGDSPVAIAYKHVREYPELPSTINPGVPADFEAIVMTAIAKDPEEPVPERRRASRADLLRFIQGQPPAASEPHVGGQATRAMKGPPPSYDEARRQARAIDELETAYQTSYDIGGAGGRRSRSAWWAALFVVLVAVLGVLVFFIGRNAGWWGSPSEIKVPPIKGDTVAQAENVLRQDGLRYTLHYEQTSLVPAGQVIGTSPTAGANVPRPGDHTGREHRAPMFAVPNLTRQTCGTADTVLRSKFLYRNVPKRSAKVPSGLVISTKPPGGTKAPKTARWRSTAQRGWPRRRSRTFRA